MSFHHWLLYVSVVLAVIVTPGPSAILCVSHGAAHGALKTMATVVGGMSASLTLMLLSALGLGAAIAASDLLFHGIRLVGAAYLIYLGVSTWRANPPNFSDLPAHDLPDRQSGLRRTLFRKGLMVGIGNPKDLLFFGSLFPQFIDPDQPFAMQLIVLAGTWLFVDGVVMLVYAKFGATLALKIKDSRLGQLFNRMTGGAFIAAGGTLAAVHR